MKKTDVEEFMISHLGTPYEVTITKWTFQRHEQINVTVRNDMVEDSVRQYVFRITDEDERECVFQKAKQDGEAKPTREVLVAVEKYGYKCKNYSPKKIADLETKDKVVPTLQVLDDTIGTILRLDNTPISERPLFQDLLDVAMTNIAFVNSILQGVDANAIPSEALDEPDVMRTTVLSECYTDEFAKVSIPWCWNRNYPELEITDEELDNLSLNDFDGALRRDIEESKQFIESQDWRP